MTRIMVTGATGFVGRHCLAPLACTDAEVHAVSSRSTAIPHTGVRWHRADLLDSQQVARVMADVQPTHLLHLAWYVAPGRWAMATENFRWVEASLDLLRRFVEHGGRRVVVAGSCTEYDWRYGYCSERRTPRAPNTVYGICKDALHMLLGAYADQTGLSSAWGRIFFLYGPWEHPDRLVSSVVRALLKDEPARCSHGNQIRDYLYVQDVADAFVALLHSDIRGPVNIGSGRPVALKDIIDAIAAMCSRQDLVRLGAVPTTPANDARLVLADVTRLSEELRWRPRHELEEGLALTIDWWKDQIRDHDRAEAGQA